VTGTDPPVYPHVFRPLRVGTLQLDHRIVVPPHGGGNGNLMGTDAEFELHCELWLSRISGGVQWLGGGPTFVRNPLPDGFEPTGVGAHGPGFFRQPHYPQRVGELARRVHAAGGYLSTQMVLQGAMPIGASATFSGNADHRVPHVLSEDEVRWLVAEYAESAAIALDAGVDAIEIHANHDDIVQLFLSPLTNHRNDAYGGDAERRMRLLREINEAIRERTSRPFTFGLRLCIDELLAGGYRLEDCQQMIATFTADGMVDYFSLDVGSNWGAPSYIPIAWHGDAEWAPLCGQAKQATHLPVIYAGRVTHPAHAEQILADGYADAVGVVRAHIADPDFVTKAREGQAERIRPCIGLNDCIHRKQVEGLPYACGVNPWFSRAGGGPTRPAATRRDLLVIGGGPAGTEAAALCAEQGHRVRLWERSDSLGGALAVAALARGNRRYAEWIAWQARRLADAGVDVRLSHEATADLVADAGADVVAVATGARPRWPDADGAGRSDVRLAVDALRQPAGLPERLAMIVEDDGPAPLSIADHLAGLGHQLTMIIRTTAPGPLVGKYSIGSMLARLDLGGVQIVTTTRVVAIDGPLGSPVLHTVHSYSGRPGTLSGFDGVVLACGAVGDDRLFHELGGRHPDVRVLGDAFAPRRMVFATRQAWALMESLQD
jgi:2,4-dienoyl-CoA reductase-like NADH-dependent reductase (Old Yellow Enzyme family)/thioredoxin reductase